MKSVRTSFIHNIFKEYWYAGMTMLTTNMKQDKIFSLVIGILACWFIFLCSLHLIQQRPLWNDEIAVFESVERFSPDQMFNEKLMAFQASLPQALVETGRAISTRGLTRSKHYSPTAGICRSKTTTSMKICLGMTTVPTTRRPCSYSVTSIFQMAAVRLSD